MESIVKFLEKGQPYFDKVSKNIYLQAIKDGFFGSNAHHPVFFCLPAYFDPCRALSPRSAALRSRLVERRRRELLQQGLQLHDGRRHGRRHHCSALTGSKNCRPPAGKAINATSTMVAAMRAMLILAVTQTSAKIGSADVSWCSSSDNIGTKGLLSPFVAALLRSTSILSALSETSPPSAAQRSPRRHRPELPRHLRLQLLHPVCRRHRRYLPHLLGRPFANVISTLVSRCSPLPIPTPASPHLVHDPAVLVHGHPRPLGR